MAHNLNIVEIKAKNDEELALSLQEQEFENSDFPCSSHTGHQHIQSSVFLPLNFHKLIAS
jgi:hypothetical protein